MTLEQVASELGRILDHHLAITQFGLAVMVGFPDAGDEARPKLGEPMPAPPAPPKPPGFLPGGRH